MHKKTSNRVASPMRLSYSGLWDLLQEKKISGGELVTLCGLNKNTLTRLRKNEGVSWETLHRICYCIRVNIGDVVRFEEEPELQKHTSPQEGVNP